MGSLMSDDFAARCRSCGATWNSATMADGLRVLGACPKCRGQLEFGARAQATPPTGRGSVAARPADATAPHLVLGIPRQH